MKTNSQTTTGKKFDQGLTVITVVLMAAALLYFMIGPASVEPVLSYSVDAFYAAREVCPGDTVRLDYEVASRSGGVFTNHRFVINDETGRNLGHEGPTYRFLDPGRPVRTEIVWAIPALPPGHYKLVNTSFRQGDTVRSDYFSFYFDVGEGCDETG
jgi:hypothetical protein